MALRSNSKRPACIDKCMLSMELITPWNKKVILLQIFQKKTKQKNNHSQLTFSSILLGPGVHEAFVGLRGLSQTSCSL